LASTIIIKYNCQREASLIPVYRRAVLIYNPVAGKLLGGGSRLTNLVLERLAADGHTVTAQHTPAAGTAADLARKAVDAGADLVLAFGGDGTINEVAEGLIGTQVPLGLIPGGTANVLACELKLGSKPESVAHRVGKWRPRRIAVGRVQCAGAPPRHFLAMAGVGLDAHIVYKMSADAKKKWGKLAYWAGGFGQLTRTLEEFDVEIDGRRHRASFALVTKVRNYGGDLQIARRVSILDDQFEIILFAGRSSAGYLKYFTGVAVNQLDGMSGVTILRARKACFRAEAGDRVYVQIDGEYAGQLPGEVELTPDALTLLMP
jgi:diacylglycerol kinase (ATP)